MRKAGHPVDGRLWLEMTNDRLDSWKEIAAYLKRSVRTVTRWEREEGLPVHRHLHSKSGSVYAYKAELEDWWKSRGASVDASSDSKGPSFQFRGARPLWIVAGTLVVLLALSAVVWLSAKRPSPVPDARLVPLTTYPGVEGPPSLSPDGNQVAFERHGDLFVKQVDGEALLQLTSGGLFESGPAWSPDGRQIAFTRDGQGIFLISPLGGAERKVADARVPLLLKSIAWTPDARSLLISELTSPICASLFVVSIETGQKVRLTTPPEPSIGDGWPAVSPDGRTVAFARYSQDTSANVYLVSLSGGEPRQLTADKAAIFGLAWTPDADLVISSDRGGLVRLWRLLAKPSSSPSIAALDISAEDARFPSISRRGMGTTTRLAYQRLIENLDVRRTEIVGEGTPHHRLGSSQPFIASTKSEDHPRYSPDGSKVAFVSRRSGTYEIWLCASDGANPVRLTSMGGPVVVGPQWSPEGRRIAFFATTGRAAAYALYIINADGGPPSRLTRTEGELEALPSWSRDGRSIYLTSSRSGSLQIWKRPLDGEESVQLTRRGGGEAVESPDGRVIYYAKVPEIGPGLWSVPVDGGEEQPVLESVRFGYWAVARRGIYFIDFDVPSEAERPVRFLDFQSGEVKQLGTVEKTVRWTNTPGFAISPDGRWLLYTSLESMDADLMVVDNFR
jgi:Tol biopolymer transport system component